MKTTPKRSFLSARKQRENESVRINKKVLEQCRRIAQREGRTISGLIERLLLRENNSEMTTCPS
jgi:hypothetical protein